MTGDAGMGVLWDLEYVLLSIYFWEPSLAGMLAKSRKNRHFHLLFRIYKTIWGYENTGRVSEAKPPGAKYFELSRMQILSKTWSWKVTETYTHTNTVIHTHTNTVIQRHTHTLETEGKARECRDKFFHRCTVEMFRVMGVVVGNGDQGNGKRNPTRRNKQMRQVGKAWTDFHYLSVAHLTQESWIQADSLKSAQIF